MGFLLENIRVVPANGSAWRAGREMRNGCNPSIEARELQ